jgi:hypothetical protein
VIFPNPRPNQPPSADAGQKVKALKQTCDDAFNYGPAATSCSHAVWYVIKALIDATVPMRVANELIKHMSTSKDWTSVTLEEGWNLANQGVVVVGGKSDTTNGHVIVIYPGDKIPGGGYEYQAKNKITGKMETLTMRSHGLFPRCLSRTMGSWPGGTSKGDKNVFDPWGNDVFFGLVKYWTMNKP